MCDKTGRSEYHIHFCVPVLDRITGRSKGTMRKADKADELQAVKSSALPCWSRGGKCDVQQNIEYGGLSSGSTSWREMNVTIRRLSCDMINCTIEKQSLLYWKEIVRTVHGGCLLRDCSLSCLMAGTQESASMYRHVSHVTSMQVELPKIKRGSVQLLPKTHSTSRTHLLKGLSSIYSMTAIYCQRWSPSKVTKTHQTEYIW